MGFAYHYFTIKPGLFEVRVFVFYKRNPAEWPDFSDFRYVFYMFLDSANVN